MTSGPDDRIRLAELMTALYAVAELAAMKERPRSIYEDRDLLIA